MSSDSSATGSSAFSGAPRSHTIKRKPAPKYIESPPRKSPLTLGISLPATVESQLEQDRVQEHRDRALAHLEGYRMDDTFRTPVAASPAGTPTILVNAPEGYEIAFPSPALLTRSDSQSTQDYGRPLSGVRHIRWPNTRNASQSSGQGSPDTFRHPNRSLRLPHKPSVVDIFSLPHPPKSVHVRSDPAYVASPVTAEFQHGDLRLPNISPERSSSSGGPAHDLARFESRTSTFVSATTGVASFSKGPAAANAPDYVVLDMPETALWPAQGAIGSASSTWHPPTFLARILNTCFARAQRGEIEIEETYMRVHELAFEHERKMELLNVSVPYLDGQAGAGPIFSVDCNAPVTPERAALWRIDTQRKLPGMHIVERGSGEGHHWRDEVSGCFPAFDAFTSCFGGREH